uniref:Uncharacterized protein n=1 Tax=Peronospora matthiolae TaxID=2874970 RepID=A0AAV1VMG3_9STRA
MVNKPMRCASARLRADAEAETAATDVPSVAEASQSVSPRDADARHEDTHVVTEYELDVSYSPDTKEGSVSKAVEAKPPAKRGMDDVASLVRLTNQMNHRQSEGARDRKTRALTVVSVLLLTPLRNENLEDVDRDVWNDKLINARDKFEKRTPIGARYKLHRLSKEGGLPSLSWGDLCPCCVNNSAHAPKEAYLLNSPWWRVRISTEMYEGIENLKSLYDRAGKTFSSGPSAAQDVPRRTAQPDPVRKSLFGSGASNYSRMGDNRATGRGNSSDVRSHRGGSTAAQPDSAGHRESPPKEVEEEGKRSPNYRGGACVSESFFDRVTLALRDDLEYERDRRLQLADTVSKHRAEVARVDIDRSRAEITALQTLVDGHHREHKALCEMLERKGVLHRKKQRTDGTA